MDDVAERASSACVACTDEARSHLIARHHPPVEFT